MIPRGRFFASTFFLTLGAFLALGLLSYQIGHAKTSGISTVLTILGITFLAFVMNLVLSYWWSQRFFNPLSVISHGFESIKNNSAKKFDSVNESEFKEIFEEYNTLVDDIAKIRDTKNLLENTMNSIQEAFFIIEMTPSLGGHKKKLNILSINPAAADMIGLPRNSLLGSNLKMWLHADYEKIFSSLKESEHKTPAFSIEGVVKQNSGATVPLELSWSLVKEQSNHPHPVLVVIGRDITWKKEFEKQLHLKEDLLRESQSLSKMGSFRWEIATGSTLWTEQVFHILGLSPEKTRPSYDLFHSLIVPEDRIHFENAMQKSRKGLRALVDVRMKKQGHHEPIWIRCNGRTEFDQFGNPIFVFGTVQDVTEIRRTEQALIIAKNEAQQSSQAKSEFLARMSHEIRTPMNAIMGMAELLKETKLSEDQQYYISIFRRAGESLMALINDILDLSKIEAGEVSIENIPFDLKKLLGEVEEIMRPRAQEKGLTASFEISPGLNLALMGDPFKLRQVMINLISNSIKFTKQGTIRLLISKNPTKKDSLMISVSDTGVGIPEDKQSLIFQKFSQADSSITRRFGGTGLGLAISKSLVELMGGQIWFRSREDMGTTFFFTTPYREQIHHKMNAKFSALANADFADTPEDLHQKERKVRILLVDDTEDNRVLFTHFLRPQPFEIIEAQNGLEALDKIKSGEFDIIFMDVQMPEIDGYAVTDRIRKWEKEQHRNPTPIIALTAHALSEDRQKSLNAGCNDHIAKPFKRETLVNVINRYTH